MRVGKAFLLAAGLGTRLRPFSERVPKPAWPLFGVPIGVHLLKKLAAAGVDDFIINLHHLKDSMARVFEEAAPPGARLRFSVEEPDILGTGGALLPWAEELGSETFFLANADTYRAFDPAGMAAFHLKRGADATLSMGPARPGVKGPMEVDGEGRMAGFLGRTSPHGGNASSSHGFTGLHVIGPRVLDAVREAGKAGKVFCVNADVHARLLEGGGKLYGYLPADTPFWSDLGTPESYLACHFAMLEQNIVPGYCPGSAVLRDVVADGGGRILAPSFVGRGAKVEAGASAGPFAVLGQASTVTGGSEVSRSVVWEGAVLEGRFDGVIFSETGETMSGLEGRGKD